LNGECEVRPFWGGFQHHETYKIGKEPTVIELEYPKMLQSVDWNKVPEMPFSPRTWRLLLPGRPVIFVGVEGEGIRPPEVSDLPGKKLIAYGTSLTQGMHASSPHLAYPAQLARRLRADAYNLAASGSAHCEKAMADHIAGRTDWDIAVLCLSVNMVGAGFTVEQFEERIDYMIRTIADSDPSRPVYCISIFPHSRDFIPDSEVSEQSQRSELFRRTLRRVTEQIGRPQIVFVEGADLLTRVDGLTADLIHPGDAGMTEIADNLARLIANDIGIPL
ncbi:MAG: SGNH-type esterase domain protein, partial [Paenibacillus sp.]|nr:SGNH-type esterase domain protein [Paenibacillus sp.]